MDFLESIIYISLIGYCIDSNMEHPEFRKTGDMIDDILISKNWNTECSQMSRKFS